MAKEYYEEAMRDVEKGDLGSIESLRKYMIRSGRTDELLEAIKKGMRWRSKVEAEDLKRKYWDDDIFYFMYLYPLSKRREYWDTSSDYGTKERKNREVSFVLKEIFQLIIDYSPEVGETWIPYRWPGGPASSGDDCSDFAFSLDREDAPNIRFDIYIDGTTLALRTIDNIHVAGGRFGEKRVEGAKLLFFPQENSAFAGKVEETSSTRVPLIRDKNAKEFLDWLKEKGISVCDGKYGIEKHKLINVKS